ncbi:MAG: M14 family metallopeptidase [Bdellovibrionota bacterium]
MLSKLIALGIFSSLLVSDIVTAIESKSNIDITITGYVKQKILINSKNNNSRHTIKYSQPNVIQAIDESITFTKPAPKAQDLSKTNINQLLESQKYFSKKKQEIPIWAEKNVKHKRFRFLIQGGLHGDELLAQKFVKWLAERYQKGKSLLNHLPSDSVAIDYLLMANPDGKAQRIRENSEGVNLNRNFPVLWGHTSENPGSYSFSEPETQAIKALFENRKYTASVDVHGFINWVVSPSNPQLLSNNQETFSQTKILEYNLWTQALKKELNTLGAYELKTAGGLGDGGAFEDWAFWQQDSLAFCLELKNQRRWQTETTELKGRVIKKGTKKIDSFLSYERYIFKMFKNAIEIKKSIAESHKFALELKQTSQGQDVTVPSINGIN